MQQNNDQDRKEKRKAIARNSRLRWPLAYLIGIPTALLYRVSYEGLENIPREPFFVVANHRSLLDLLALQFKMPRWVHWIAKQSLFSIPVIGWFVHRLGAIPLTRDRRDSRAVRTVLQLAKEGCSIGIFPQGTRVKEADLNKVLPSGNAANLVSRSGLSVLPVAFAREWKLFRKQRIIIGRPFKIDRPSDKSRQKEEFSRIMMDIMRKIFALADLEWQPERASKYGSEEQRN
ncbi:MAG: lysophospholipid acyltransferase family protein [Saccharofermentanales bacterium]|jgi:1-acyl-sn-glycerol-3-phosphate acyltransferase|nr:lysophospholipid acyltransferase family protein [Bacillota bacterium]NLB08221.1 1-acyl-sn-glycerol-3-phosphate acyltransferase [Clostridiales bacterium]